MEKTTKFIQVNEDVRSEILHCLNIGKKLDGRDMGILSEGIADQLTKAIFTRLEVDIFEKQK